MTGEKHRQNLALAAVAVFSLLGAAPRTQQQRPKLTIIGASLSKGFIAKAFAFMAGGEGPREFVEKRLGRKLSDLEFEVRTDGIGLRSLLRKCDDAGKLDIRDYSDLYFFRDPRKKGAAQLERALARGGLVLAIDFMFWFGYGSMGWPGRGYTSEDLTAHRALRRLSLQQEGFRLLETHMAGKDCTIVLGDYPDMSGALPMIMPASMIPIRRVREELNARLRAWAAKHPRVLVYPLEERMATVRAGKFAVASGEGTRKLGVAQVLQLDRLHPTKLGMAALASDLFAWIREKDAALARHLPAETEFDRIVALLGETDTLAEFDKIAIPKKALEAGSGK